MSDCDFDIILVGGGLANALIAWRLHQQQPSVRTCVLEQAPALGANHTWSFHGSDLSAAQHNWLAPVVVQTWSRQEVIFPGYKRQLETTYHTITSARLDAIVAAALGETVRTHTPVASVHARGVTLADGSELSARCVLDGRGAKACAALATGFQTFVGLEVELQAPHGLDTPVLMDACVEQLDGYRFVYLLPFTKHRLLIEDTYYNDHPRLDATALDARIHGYIESRRWQVRQVLRREQGVLPIVMAGARESLSASTPDGVVPVGVRAGLFHTVTGYSLPFAVELADRLAALPLHDANAVELVRQTATQYAHNHWRKQAFDRLLARMLFIAAAPTERRRIFERFYGLSHSLIERFYAARLRTLDKARILTGKPPTSVLRALPCLWPSSAFRASHSHQTAKKHT
jgi:lycopene beta-cyclase